jgi:hypothetical protein
MTIDEFADCGRFQGRFQFQFEEEFRKRDGYAEDVAFVGAARFSFTAKGEGEYTGGFSGEATTTAGPRGQTTGTLQLSVPAGLEGDPDEAMDSAELKVQIGSFPGL